MRKWYCSVLIHGLHKCNVSGLQTVRNSVQERLAIMIPCYVLWQCFNGRQLTSRFGRFKSTCVYVFKASHCLTSGDLCELVETCALWRAIMAAQLSLSKLWSRQMVIIDQNGGVGYKRIHITP